MAKILRRPRVRSLIAATAVAGGLVLGMAAPAQANYVSPKYWSEATCLQARPKYVSSWTSPGPCAKHYTDNPIVKTAWWDFIVYTRY